MHKVAMASSSTFVHFKLTTTGLSKVCNRRELSNNRFPSIESSNKSSDGLFSIFFFGIFYIYISNHVIADIFADIKLFDLSVIGELFPNIFIEIFKKFSGSSFIHSLDCWIGIESYQEKSLTHCWFIVSSLAFVSMTA